MRGEIITRDEMLAIPAYEISDLGQIPAEPLVSIIVITYNHEAYVEETIEGILAQQCDFPIELIIGEDKSTDRTLEICLDYQKRYPHLIRLVTWHENVGANANFLRCWGRARGKYVAICEGDDYWIDPHKLTKQVTLMEQSPGTTLCGARTQVVVDDPTKKQVDSVIGLYKSKIEYNLRDVLSTYLFHTSTFMCRKSALPLTQHARSIEYLDGFLQCLSAIHGGLKCLPDVVSVYRQHPGGICVGSSQDRHFDRCSTVCIALFDILGERDKWLVNRTLDVVQSRRCHHLLNDGRTSEARRLARGLLPRLARHNFRRAVQLLVHVCLPGGYGFLKRLRQDGGIARYARRLLP